jgi:AcrR family transcriptional regulator
MSGPSGRPGGGRREQRRRETRRTIQEHALRLFLADGYEATTVERIAAAAGVSHMTFFRHFPTKESVVDTDDYDPMIAALIRDRPAGEGPVTAIHRALVHALRAMPPDEHAALRVRTRLIVTTPALRARMWENQYATTELLATALAGRESADQHGGDPGGADQQSTGPGGADQQSAGPGGGGHPLHVRVPAAVALAVLTTALTAWVEGPDDTSLPDLVDAAFAALPREAP